jgi:hypothetical protein
VEAIERPATVVNFTSKFLDTLKGYVMEVREQWEGKAPEADSLLVEHTTEFYRTWSAIQFAFCLPSINASEFTSRYGVIDET